MRKQQTARKSLNSGALFLVTKPLTTNLPCPYYKKIPNKDGLFFVATKGTKVSGTSMAGYNGHQGWLYAVVILPEHRVSGLENKLVRTAEEALTAVGCMKINLQLFVSNEATAAFYKSLGYTVKPRVRMGKVLPNNISLASLMSSR